MNIAKIKNKSIENGPGIRTSVFVSGCPIHCKGCQNEFAQDFNYGVPFSNEWLEEIAKDVSEPYCSGITVLGGEPLCSENIDHTLFLCSYIRRVVGKSVWVYTGYTFEHLMEHQFKDMHLCLVPDIDVLVDGPYVESLRDPSLKFRGSSNQRILDFKKSYWQGTPHNYDI